MRRIFLLTALLLAVCVQAKKQEAPRIVNIINFIRQCEPREPERLPPSVLYETTLTQARTLREHNLKGTWLLQYDALIDPRYQALMKEELARGCEVGGWLEVPQPLVEDAGLQWRSNVPWDYHAQVDFTIGYTPEERVRLADTYMAKFRQIFGFYPQSMGSWFIDGFTLNHLAETYHIEASVNCRDQVGTDGYTLWGGYWTGGYYPSKRNAYMPAQTSENRVAVPVFRMLGSDPIYQYDAGVGHGVWQRVVTLEPYCGEGGANDTWLDWYFDAFCEAPALTLNYTQVGQENSFPWPVVESGYRKQVKRLVQLAEAGKVQIKLLSETGREFSRQHRRTPASGTVALRDYTDGQRRTVWFNSRNYRVNLLWENGTLRIRDLHCFDENYPSRYIDNPCTTHDFKFYTLPMVDGNLWSTAEHLAGLRFYAGNAPMKGGEPQVTCRNEKIRIVWPLSDGQSLTILLTENALSLAHSDKAAQWQLELDVAEGTTQPFTAIEPSVIRASQEGFDYEMQCTKGQITDLRNQTDGHILRITPQKGKIVLKP